MNNNLEEVVQAIQNAVNVARSTDLVSASHIKTFEDAIHAARKRKASQEYKAAVAARKAVRAERN